MVPFFSDTTLLFSLTVKSYLPSRLCRQSIYVQHWVLRICRLSLSVVKCHQSIEITSRPLQNRSRNTVHLHCDWFEENRILRDPPSDHLLSSFIITEPPKSFRCTFSVLLRITKENIQFSSGVFILFLKLLVTHKVHFITRWCPK